MVTPHARKKALKLQENRQKVQAQLDEVAASIEREDREIVEQIEDISRSLGDDQIALSLIDIDIATSHIRIEELEKQIKEEKAAIEVRNTDKINLQQHIEQRRKLLAEVKAIQESNVIRERSPHRHLAALKKDVEKLDRRIHDHLARNPGADDISVAAPDNVTVGMISGKVLETQKGSPDV